MDWSSHAEAQLDREVGSVKDVFAGVLVVHLVPAYYRGPFISLVATSSELTIGVGLFFWRWETWRIPASLVTEFVRANNGWLVKHTARDAPEKVVLWQSGPSDLGDSLRALGYAVRTEDRKIGILSLD